MVTSVSSLAAKKRIERALRPGNQPPTFTRDVTIGGRDATLVGAAAAGRPLVSLQAIIELEDALVIAHAGSSYDENSREVNPLMDEATFLAVLEGLRPYPE